MPPVKAAPKPLTSPATETSEGAPAVTAPTDTTVVIHFVRDGMVVAGRQWFKGDELVYTPGSPEHKRTYNRRGESWLDYDEDRQEYLYSEVHFRPGPYTGKKFAEMTDRELAAVRATGNPIAPRNSEEAAASDKRRRRVLGRVYASED